MNREKKPPADADSWERSKKIASEAHYEFRKIAERGKWGIIVKSAVIMFATSMGFTLVAHFALCLFA